MKKPKIKKYKKHWIVYIKRNQAFECYNEETTQYYYNFLRSIQK